MKKTLVLLACTKIKGVYMKSRTCMWNIAICLLTVLAITLQLAAQDHPDHQPTITTFDAPGAGTGAGQGTFAVIINPAGTIAGFAHDANDVRHGFLRSSADNFTTFDAPGAGTGAGQGTRAYGITPAGVIAGYYDDASSVSHGYVRAADGTITTFDAPGAGTSSGQGTIPYGTGIIDPAGAITGHYVDSSGVYHGFLRAPDGTITGFDPAGSLLTEPLSINQAGITGFYCDAINCPGFLRAPDGSMTTFDVPGDVNGTQPNGINPAGAITGLYFDASAAGHGFLRAKDGTITTFDVQGAGTGFLQGTFPQAINPAGAITGFYIDTSYANHGFLRAKDGTITTFDAPGAGSGSGQGTSPFGINPPGAITGYDTDGSGVYHGFLATPCNGKHCEDEGDHTTAAGSATRERPKITLPENVRNRLRRGLYFPGPPASPSN